MNKDCYRAHHASRTPLTLLLATAFSLFSESAFCQKVDVQWDKVERLSRTTPTLQVVVNPPLRRGSPIHDRVYSELEKLGAENVRYVPWLPYPKLGVAELKSPADGKTFWDFSLIDPMTIDFFNATKGHAITLNFSTIPAWMFLTPKPVAYPDDPNEATWNFTQGTELRDKSLKELGDYYARLVGWYVNGGFTDELGVRHDSGHHFKIDYWEVLNEPDLEHTTTPEQYTERYDAIVSAVHSIAPSIKFVGLGMAFTYADPRMYEYFLNPRNHKPGIPLDMISYHFYATPLPDQTPEIQQHVFFEQADRFIATVRYIELIRKRLSPETRTTINEIGSISADDLAQSKPGHVTKPIPAEYWHLSGATYAYLFGQLSSLGIEYLGESQLVGYPTQFPSVSLVDWNTGAPNPRFRVLQLLKENFRPGDRMVATRSASPYVYAAAFITYTGERKLLLVNKRNRAIDLVLPGTVKSIEAVDLTTKDSAPVSVSASGSNLKLQPFGVAVVVLQLP